MKYVCYLESGRDFILTAKDDMEAAYEAKEEARWYDDYLIDIEPIDESYYVPYPTR